MATVSIRAATIGLHFFGIKGNGGAAARLRPNLLGTLDVTRWSHDYGIGAKLRVACLQWVASGLANPDAVGDR
jgi:hypothetical protein